MKRFIILLSIAVLIAGSMFAQERGVRPDFQNRQERQNQLNQPNRQRENTAVTIEGTIKIDKGFITLESGDSKYFVPLFSRYAGSIEGIKDGAKVSVEGYSFKNMIQPNKAEIDGKSYIFVQPPRDNAQSFGNHRFDNRGNDRMQRPERKDFFHGKKMKPGRHGGGHNCR